MLLSMDSHPVCGNAHPTSRILAIAGSYQLKSGTRIQNIQSGDSKKYLWSIEGEDIVVTKTAGSKYTRVCGGNGWQTILDVQGGNLPDTFAIPVSIWEPEYKAGNTIVFRES